MKLKTFNMSNVAKGADVMTNRDAFNKYIRDELENKIRCVESMSNEELVDHVWKYTGYRIESRVGDELCYYQVTETKQSCFGREQMKEWLSSER